MPNINYDLNTQKPASTNSILNEKPIVKKTETTLTGYLATSMNGGMIKPIYFKQVMAGEKIKEMKLRINVKMLTPRTPSFQKLKLVLKTFFVPNKRIWTNADKFEAQKGGATQIKIKEIPNLGNAQLPIFLRGQDNTNVAYTDTDLWRDSYTSSYLPRYLTSMISERYNEQHTWPKVSVLPLRGFKAIYNDMLRNKEYDEPLEEYFDDGVSGDEIQSYFMYNNDNAKKLKKLLIRGKAQDSYYTNMRTELQGEYTTEPGLTDRANALSTLTEWEKRIAEVRSQAENAQRNDWDIVAEIRGAEKLNENIPLLLSMQEIPLNYSMVTQTTYNTNEEVEEEYQALGTQGAYSYTETEKSVVLYFDCKQSGYIHCIAQVTADNVYSTGFDRLELNTKYDDIYTPDKKEIKDDVLYSIEKNGTMINSTTDLTKIDGYKRKFSEYFKMPNLISGDMTNNRYFMTERKDDGTNTENFKEKVTDTMLLTNGSYSFFQDSDRWYKFNDNDYFYSHEKMQWLDYTDILLNKNSAVAQPIEEINDYDNNYFITRIKGQNQIFMVGMASALVDLPIDETIKMNFTKWGEE